MPLEEEGSHAGIRTQLEHLPCSLVTIVQRPPLKIGQDIDNGHLNTETCILNHFSQLSAYDLISRHAIAVMQW